MRDKVLFLGSGGSMGVPVIGCACEVCTSFSSRDKRLRPSVLLKKGGQQFIIDMGPDYRQQALKYRINVLDGILLTHAHYDHIGGLDEVRIYTFRNHRPVPCLLSRATWERLKTCYHYLFPKNEKEGMFKFHILDNLQGKTIFEGLEVRYFSYIQSGMYVNGLRVNKLAYVTDIMEYEETVFDALEGIETLIISARRWERSSAHLSIEQTIEFARRVKARWTYFTHISHEIHYEKTMQKLPDGFALAYDGMELLL